MSALLLLLFPLAILGLAISSDDDDPDDTVPDPERPSDGGDLLDTPDGPANPKPLEPEPFEKTPDGRRVFEGTDEGQTFLLSSTDDVVFARGGDDTVVGGNGDDELFMGDGDDRTFPRDGAYNRGSSGPSVLYFGDYSSSGGPIQGDGGDDVIRGGAGSDEIKDRQGADRLYGDTGNDILDARDTIDATAAPDSLFGGLGRDVLIADAGDIVSGGDNPDRFAIAQSDLGDEAVTITDYEAGEIIAVELRGATPQDVFLRLSDSGEDTEIVLDDAVIGRLTGVTDPTSVRLDFIDNLDEVYSFSPLGR